MAAAADTVDGARRTVGTGVEVATQYPGGRVEGVRLGDDHVEVHIVAERVDVRRAGDEVRRAVSRCLAEIDTYRQVTVIVDDVDIARLDRTSGGRR